MQDDCNKVPAEATDERLTQFRLVATRRLAPLFVTQFFGAFNDNLFKAALLVLFVYGGLVAQDASDFAVNAAAALFVLPFFLFSATAGELSDKYEKSRLIRLVKIGEICVAFLAGVSLYFHNLTLMLVVLFLFGLQSTFFGPLKFSILPQHLHQTELVGGNAMIEMGTFVAILLGTLAGSTIGGMGQVSAWLFVLVLAVAVVGWLASRHVPVAPASAPNQRINWNPFTATWRVIALARGDRDVFLAILGISWFWLVGGVYLAQIPNLAQDHLAGGPGVVTLILAVFTVAVGAGSLLCERLSGRRIEIGLVPIAAFGISAVGIEVYYSITAVEASAMPLRDVGMFLTGDGSLRVLFGLLLTGVFGGMYVVPLMAFIQARTPEPSRARIIAAANIVNAAFMVVGAIVAVVWLTVLDRTIPELFALIALINIVVAAYIFNQVPEFSMRFIVWLLSHTMYRVTHRGLESIPDKGAAIIVCNHVSAVDALLIGGAVRRPIRFVMLKPIYDMAVLNFVFRTGRTIPIVGRRIDEAAYEDAFRQIREGLADGDLLCIFPEGKLTLDGRIDEFRPGIERILGETPVPVVPMALRGLWGSFFSRDGGLYRNPKRLWSRVEIVAGTPLGPKATANELREKVLALRGEFA